MKYSHSFLITSIVCGALFSPISCANDSKDAYDHDALVKKAVQTIKHELSLVKSGTPVSVACTYLMDENGPILSSSKIYYADYRKQPDYRKIASCCNVDKDSQVVEVVYRPAKKRSLTLREKHPTKRKRCLAKKNIQLASDICV